jgi:COP9 signalosome complex subunit 2
MCDYNLSAYNLSIRRDLADQQILKSLHASCEPGANPSEDQSRGSVCKLERTRPFHADMIVLELYAIEIQMYSDLKETRKLKVS